MTVSGNEGAGAGIRWHGIAVVAAAIIGLALLGLAGALLLQRPDLTVPQKWNRLAPFAVWIPMLVMALLIVWRGERTYANRMLALAIALVGLDNGLTLLQENLRSAGPDWLAILEQLGAWPASAIYVRASQSFPSSLTIAQLETTPGSGWWTRGRKALLRLFLSPWRVWASMLLLTQITWLGGDALDAVISLLVVLLGAAYWHAQWAAGDDEQRRKVLWILQTALSFALLSLIAMVLSALLTLEGARHLRAYVAIPFNFTAAAVVVGCMAMAIFHAGAVSPELIIRRTLIYGLAVAIVMFVLEMGLHFLVDVTEEYFEISGKLVAAAFGALAGLAFEPVAHRIRKTIDHRH